MIFLPRQGAADAEGGLKGPEQLRRSLQGFGGGWPPTSTRRVYTRALLASFTELRELKVLLVLKNLD